MNIVVGYVDSPEGEAALNRAIDEALLRDGRLLLVHSTKGGPGESVDEVLAYREVFESISERLRAQGIDHEVLEMVRGNSPVEDLLEVVADNNAEMIVIGLRRRSPIGKLIMGSNAEQILLRADCAVLAVKAEAP